MACVAGDDSGTMAATATTEKLLLATYFLLRLTGNLLPAGMERADVNGTAGGLRRWRWWPEVLEDGDTCSRRNS